MRKLEIIPESLQYLTTDRETIVLGKNAYEIEPFPFEKVWNVLEEIIGFLSKIRDIQKQIVKEKYNLKDDIIPITEQAKVKFIDIIKPHLDTFPQDMKEKIIKELMEANITQTIDELMPTIPFSDVLKRFLQDASNRNQLKELMIKLFEGADIEDIRLATIPQLIYAITQVIKLNMKQFGENQEIKEKIEEIKANNPL